MGLNFIPCDDVVESVDKENISVNVEIDHDSQEDADNCPPFCECHCCHVHVVNFDVPGFKAIEASISTLIIQKGENSGKEIPNFHFQPPRI